MGDFPSARHPALHTVSVWVPVKPRWPFAGEHSVTLLALCEIWVRNTAASTAPSCPKLLPSIQPAGHVDPSGQGARMAEGSPCEGFRSGEHPSCLPLVNTRPWHHWALSPAPFAAAALLPWPRPSCSLARQRGSPNSPALVSLALLWLPSHPLLQPFHGLLHGMGRALAECAWQLLSAGYNSLFLSPVHECASVSCASPAASAQPGTGWICLFKALSLRQSFPPMESEDEIA